MASPTKIPPQAPPRIIPAEEVVPTMNHITARKVAVRNTILRTVTQSTATYENTVKLIADIQNDCSGELAVIAMLRYASPSKAAREASDEAIGLMRCDDADFTSNKPLFLLVNAVRMRGEVLGAEEAKYLSFIHREFKKMRT